MTTEKAFRDREILSEAHSRGSVATLGAFFRLSGPGWLQSAITLGGGSLGGALYLGVIGGSSMLWLQLVAIVIGVIMLSAISYVTLSTGRRPYGAINEFVNPVLGASWITATILANMIFILPQFSLCFDVLDKNFGMFGEAPTESSKIIFSAVIGVLAFGIVVLSFKPGFASRMFDALLKLIVGAIVICFVMAVVFLARTGKINGWEVLQGFIPDFSQWFKPSPGLADKINGLDESARIFWRQALVERQQSVMISTTATAVGINMTFLLPYSMLARGWDKPFRGLARWDLMTGMAIPFIVVTTCIVLASANAFHAKIDTEFQSDDWNVVQQSRLFKGTESTIMKRMEKADPNSLTPPASLVEDGSKQWQSEQVAKYIAGMKQDERIVASALVKPNTEALAKTLQPVLGNWSNTVFGLGVLGMGFSTIIILMLINGYAVAEIFNRYQSNWLRIIGAGAACAVGFCWFWIWTGDSKTYLVIVASSFAAILLPIAYFTFMALMNNRELLGDEKPTGIRMTIWNVLMGVGVVGALLQSVAAVSTKIDSPNGPYVIGGVVTFVILALVGFSARPRRESN
jgi:Mn2+/Fe2+ NRAMP family transporter